METLGPYRLRIRLKRALGDFIYRLSMPFSCPLPTTTPVVAVELHVKAPLIAARVDPETGEVETIELRASPGGVVAAFGAVWTSPGE